MLSRRLVELERNVDTAQIIGLPSDDDAVTQLRMQSLDDDRLLGFFKKMGFYDLRKRVENMIRTTKMV